MVGNTFRGALLSTGIWVERVVPNVEIEQLLRDLAPRTSTIPLLRAGGPADGGYVVPDDFVGIGACISPGVFDECSFDLDMAARGIEVHMADASVAGPPVANERFRFSKLFLDTYTSESTITLDTFCAPQSVGSGDLILEMDIEGAEYRVLQAASDETIGRFRIMVIEFHHLANLFTPFGFMEIANVFRRLLRTHGVVHIHPNNIAPPVVRGGVAIPPVMEFTFLRRDRGTFGAGVRGFPNQAVDAVNHPDRADVALPPSWQV